MYKVLHIPEWYPTKDRVQNGGFVRQWILALSRQTQEYKHKVVYYERSGKSSSRVISSSEIEELVHVKHENTNAIGRLWKHLQFIYSLRKELKQADLLHIHIIGKSGLLAMRWAHRQGIPYVVHEHFSGWIKNSEKTMRHRYPFLEEYLSLLHNANSIFVTSQALRNALLQYIDKEITVVGNIIPNLYKPEALAKRSLFTFGIIADFREHIKHLIPIILAFKDHIKRYADHRLVLIGDGPDRSHILAAADGCPEIKWLGQKNQEEVHRILPSFHVVISNSALESFGMTLFEALSAGLPVILRKNGTTEHILDTSAGIILESDCETSELSHAMAKIHEEYSTFSPENLRQFAQSFLPEHATQPILHDYASMLTKV